MTKDMISTMHAAELHGIILALQVKDDSHRGMKRERLIMHVLSGGATLSRPQLSGSVVIANLLVNRDDMLDLVKVAMISIRIATLE